jgi:hypothetical protein
VGICIFFQYVCLILFRIGLGEFWSKSFILLSCGLGAALMHTGINYYYFNDALNTLAAKWFFKDEVLQLLNQGKINTQWQELLTVSQYQKLH